MLKSEWRIEQVRFGPGKEQTRFDLIELQKHKFLCFWFTDTKTVVGSFATDEQAILEMKLKLAYPFVEGRRYFDDQGYEDCSW